MAIQKRSSPTQLKNDSTQNLKQRVINCLNKLSDRDTHLIAITELESIGRNLSHDSFSPFLNCINETDSSEKTPVRKQCVRILGFLSEVHGDALSPFVSKMISIILRRLRDSDSVVRSACIDSVTLMASQISKLPFSIFLNPLMETLLIEQDYNLQIGSSLCLASAIGVIDDPEPVELKRFCPRLMKLLKSESFKPKPALLSLIGSIVGIGGTSVSRNLMKNLIPCLIEFLSSEDWSTRKAAAEALAKLAVVAEKDSLSEFRSSCLMAFEARRFDKVKMVREIINGMIEAWKQIPNSSNQDPSSSSSSSRGLRDNSSSRSCSTITIESPPSTRRQQVPTRKSSPRDSSSMTTTSRRRSSVGSSDTKSSTSLFRKLDFVSSTTTNGRVGDTSPPRAPSLTEEDLKERNGVNQEPLEQDSNGCPNFGTESVAFNKNNDDKLQKFGELRKGSRVFPVKEHSSNSNVGVSNESEEFHEKDKYNEDLSLIRNQLIQIENQQSSLFELIQKFIGSSRNGIRSLETRVLGLETAIGCISQDLAMSSRRLPNINSMESTCCKLPGTDFLSLKLRRKTEDHYSTSKFSSIGFSVNPLAEMSNHSKTSSGINLESFREERER